MKLTQIVYQTLCVYNFNKNGKNNFNTSNNHNKKGNVKRNFHITK